MHIDDMTAAQRRKLGGAALACLLGTALAVFWEQVWMTGVLGYVLIAMCARQAREMRPGFDRVQLFASLCAVWILICMALGGTAAAPYLRLALPVGQVFLSYALWQAFGRMCADGNRVGLGALCAFLLHAALTLACAALARFGLSAPVAKAAGDMAFGFLILAAVLTAAFLLFKKRKLEEKQ